MAAADQDIPVHYRTTYKMNVQHLLNNEGSILRPWITEQAVDGDKPQIIDQYGVTRGQPQTDRYGDTPVNRTPRDRRWVFPRTFDWGDIIDKKDKIKTVLDPTSPIVTGAAWGLGENIDYDMILPNFFAPAKKGQEAEIIETFDDSKFSVAADVRDAGSGNTGLNVKKVKRGRQILRKYKNKLQRENPIMAITAEDEDWLLEDMKAIHGDYIRGRPLESGDLPNLLKTQFVIIEDIPTDPSTGLRMNPMWVRSGMTLGIADDITVEMAKNPGKRFNMQIYADVTGSATRNEAGKVIKILNTTGFPA